MSDREGPDREILEVEPPCYESISYSGDREFLNFQEKKLKQTGGFYIIQDDGAELDIPLANSEFFEIEFKVKHLSGISTFALKRDGDDYIKIVVEEDKCVIIDIGGENKIEYECNVQSSYLIFLRKVTEGWILNMDSLSIDFESEEKSYEYKFAINNEGDTSNGSLLIDYIRWSCDKNNSCLGSIDNNLSVEDDEICDRKDNNCSGIVDDFELKPMLSNLPASDRFRDSSKLSIHSDGFSYIIASKSSDVNNVDVVKLEQAGTTRHIDSLEDVDALIGVSSIDDGHIGVYVKKRQQTGIYIISANGTLTSSDIHDQRDVRDGFITNSSSREEFLISYIEKGRLRELDNLIVLKIGSGGDFLQRWSIPTLGLHSLVEIGQTYGIVVDDSAEKLFVLLVVDNRPNFISIMKDSVENIQNPNWISISDTISDYNTNRPSLIYLSGFVHISYTLTKGNESKVEYKIIDENSEQLIVSNRFDGAQLKLAILQNHVAGVWTRADGNPIFQFYPGQQSPYNQYLLSDTAGVLFDLKGTVQGLMLLRALEDYFHLELGFFEPCSSPEE